MSKEGLGHLDAGIPAWCGLGNLCHAKASNSGAVTEGVVRPALNLCCVPDLDHMEVVRREIGHGVWGRDEVGHRINLEDVLSASRWHARHSSTRTNVAGNDLLVGLAAHAIAVTIQAVDVFTDDPHGDLDF